jgi:hypothetical protein
MVLSPDEIREAGVESFRELRSHVQFWTHGAGVVF